MNELLTQGSEWLDSLTLNPIAESFVIVAISVVLAKTGDLFLINVLGRMIAKTKSNLDDIVLQLLHRPVFTSLFVIGLLIATQNLADQLGETYLPITLSILKTLIIVVWLQFLLRSSSHIIHSMRNNPRRFNYVQIDTAPLFRNLAVVFLLLAGVYSILVAWDINVTGLVASAGIVGLALSFAAQDTLSHLFAGVAILADRPYRIGDYIVLDSGERGKVTAIGLRSTRLMTRDDVEVSIPNGVMGSATIVNESSGIKRFRIRASVGAAYGSDVNKVLSILDGIGASNEQLLQDPAPRSRFRAFGASSLDFELLAWIPDPEMRGLRIHEMNIEINRRFAEEGITIPFPQQDVWIKQLPENNSGNDA